jgi:hypothetical protein
MQFACRSGRKATPLFGGLREILEIRGAIV